MIVVRKSGRRDPAKGRPAVSPGATRHPDFPARERVADASTLPARSLPAGVLCQEADFFLGDGRTIAFRKENNDHSRTASEYGSRCGLKPSAREPRLNDEKVKLPCPPQKFPNRVQQTGR